MHKIICDPSHLGLNSDDEYEGVGWGIIIGLVISIIFWGTVMWVVC